MEPRWLVRARTYTGLRETPGSGNNPKILQWFHEIHADWFREDAVPWCSAFVGGVLEECGIRSSRSAAAISYKNWGVALREPAVGAVVVFPHHVGFVVRRMADGHIVVFGGNQGDMVKESKFAPANVVGYRWPTGESLPNQSAPTGADASQDKIT